METRESASVKPEGRCAKRNGAAQRGMALRTSAKSTCAEDICKEHWARKLTQRALGRECESQLLAGGQLSPETESESGD